MAMLWKHIFRFLPFDSHLNYSQDAFKAKKVEGDAGEIRFSQTPRAKTIFPFETFLRLVWLPLCSVCFHRMEDLLQNIIKEAAGKQLQNLKQAAQIAHGKRLNSA